MPPRHRGLSRLLLALLWLSAPLAAGAAPQACDNCTAAPTDPSTIVVTAQRRAQNIDDVPLSVLQISGTTLERDGIVDVGGLTARVPGFAANTNGIPTLYLRGIGSNDLGAGGDPSVGTYQDGLYLGRSTGSIFDLLDVERVEVIRGPQGVLFGRNSAGGALNVITRQPDERRAASLSGHVGTLGERRLSGVYNAPVTDAVRVRVAAGTFDRDGYIHDRFYARDISTADQWVTRATLAYAPSARVALRFQVGAESKDTDGTSSRSTNQSYLTGTPFDAYYSDLAASFEERDIRSATLALDLRFGAWSLTASMASRTVDYSDLVDSTGTGLAARRLYAGTDEENRQLGQELLVQRNFGDHHFIAGASYYRQHSNQLSHLESTSDTVNFAVSRQLGRPVVVLPPGRFHEENSWNGGTTRSESAFADLTTRLAPRWELVTGVRYSEDRKNHAVDGMGSNNGFAVVFPNTPNTPSRNHWTDWSPRTAVSFRATPASLAYLQYSAGYKSGGFNSFVPATAFAPEQIDQVELGYKWSGASERVSARVAAFNYDYRDLQVSVIESGRAVIRNAARAEGQGLDVDVTARLNEHVNVSVVAGWLDATFTEFTTGTAQSLAGNALTFSPDRQASAALATDHTVGRMRLQGSVVFSYSGQQYFDVSNTPAAAENAVRLLDASLSFEPAASGLWRATLFGRNLTDTDYVTSIGGIAKDTLAAPASKRALPRTVGVRVDLRFE